MSDYLTVRPMLSERHLPQFSGLSHHEVLRTVVRLQQDQMLPPRIGYPSTVTGEWLFRLCREAGMDHAAVVFPLCRESDDIGLGALQKLIGKSINVWRRPVYEPRKPTVLRDGTAVAPRSAGTFSPDMVVLSVVPTNPKKQGSSTWHRFQLWVPGRTIAQVMAAGLTRADVLWDIDASRRFVTIGTAQQWAEMQAPAPVVAPLGEECPI